MNKRSKVKGTLQFTTFRKKIVLEPELEQMFQQYKREGGTTEAMSRTLLGDDVYVRRVRMPKWNVPVTMLMEPKVAIRYNTSWGIPTSKSAHSQRADMFVDLAQKLTDEWNATVSLAAEAYGDQGSLISGVYRDHFPDSVKDRLRFLAYGSTMAKDAARLHEYLSTTRSPLFH